MFLIILIISIETLTMRVLITVPTKSGYGGVTNYYLGIKAVSYTHLTLPTIA